MYPRLTAVGIRCADHVTPLYPQKLALASLADGGRSVVQSPVGLLRHWILSNIGYHSTSYALTVPHISEFWPEDGQIRLKHVVTIKY